MTTDGVTLRRVGHNGNWLFAGTVRPFTEAGVVLPVDDLPMIPAAGAQRADQDRCGVSIQFDRAPASSLQVRPGLARIRVIRADTRLGRPGAGISARRAQMHDRARVLRDVATYAQRARTSRPRSA